jgi:uncharacterized protein
MTSGFLSTLEGDGNKVDPPVDAPVDTPVDTQIDAPIDTADAASDAPDTPDTPTTAPADWQLARSRQSLQQTVEFYTEQLRSRQQNQDSLELQATLKTEIDRLSVALDKLNTGLIRIAVFGLVSRGKSAVVNALVGQKLLQTGPLHGVTQYPRSIYWSVAEGQVQIELIDTPGLDEVDGALQETMAQQVATQADLILFVVAGEISQRETEALVQLQTAAKPILLVFNKTDLYPQVDRTAIAQILQVSQSSGQFPVQANDIALVAAEPAPIQVQTEQPDGTITHSWETAAPDVVDLKQKLLTILNREGKALLSLNALRQAAVAEGAIAQKTMDLLRPEADALIWQYAQWKAIAVAANPFAVLDLMGGAVSDLLMIRALARLYGLPMTSHEAANLQRSILWSSGGLLISEWASGFLFGVGKGVAAIASAFDSVSGLAAYSSAAIAQASLAGYGSYRVGQAAQLYLANGCAWGPQGTQTSIRDLLAQVDGDTVMARLRQALPL